MAIGRVIGLPRTDYDWGRVRDEYGNSWNVHRSNIPEGKRIDSEIAYRLDFSNPMASPQIVEDDD